jgi:hypothetical protein
MADQLDADVFDVVATLYPREDATTSYRYASICGFLRRLPKAEVIDAARIAWERFPTVRMARFRYFCGVCWRKIKQPEDGR